MAIVASATFTGRGDNDPLVSGVDTLDTGQVWLVPSGSWKYKDVSGGVLESNLGLNIAVAETSLSDCDVSAVSIAGGNQIGLTFRYVDVNNYFRAFFRPSDGFGRIEVVVAGVATEIGAATTHPTVGQVLKITLAGNTITTFVNGVQKDVITNNNHLTATKHGLYGANSGCQIDNFKVESTGSGTSGSISYATKQTINRIASTAYATKQAINQTASVAFATKQIIRAVGLSAFATKQTINRIASNVLATKQSIYRVGSIAYATQQTVTNLGIPGSLAYSTKQAINQVASLLAATRQSIFQTGSITAAVKQEIYQIGTATIATKQTVYRVGSLDAAIRLILFETTSAAFATKQAIFVVGYISYPAHQAITDLFYDQTIMFNIPIKRGLKFDAAIKRSEDFGVVITRTKNFNIRL